MIGLKRNTVKLEEYNPLWQEEFKKEKEILSSVLGNEVLGIYHIGSTAIPGIHAKPIIDIAVEVNSFKVLDLLDDKLQERNIIYRPMHDGPGERLYIKGDNDFRTHHIHFYEKDNLKLKDDLFFRDYLISHPDVANEYDKLKTKLAENYANDREKYTKSKKDFIENVLKERK
jgi:GrpB-like predicted nucleotidyltransferase (UPF0157 family)